VRISRLSGFLSEKTQSKIGPTSGSFRRKEGSRCYILLFTARHYASAVYDVVVCLYVDLPITRQYNMWWGKALHHAGLSAAAETCMNFKRHVPEPHFLVYLHQNLWLSCLWVRRRTQKVAE